MKIARTLALFLILAFSSCTNNGGAPVSLEINLFNGVPLVAKLGDSEKLFNERAQKYDPQKAQISRSPASGDAIKFSAVYSLKDYGMRIYFRNGRVALIELQDPFRGSIIGKKIKVFNLDSTQKVSWEKMVIKEFGIPSVRAAGGRLSSEAFFYSWGDIAFNKMGPNEIAMYRDWDIANFRQKNFGRNVKLFKEN